MLEFIIYWVLSIIGWAGGVICFCNFVERESVGSLILAALCFIGGAMFWFLMLQQLGKMVLL